MLHVCIYVCVCARARMRAHVSRAFPLCFACFGKHHLGVQIYQQREIKKIMHQILIAELMHLIADQPQPFG